MRHRQGVTNAVAAAALIAVPVLAGCSDDSSDSTATTVTMSSQASSNASSPMSTSPGAPSGDDRDLAGVKPAIAWRDAVATAKRETGGEPTTVRLQYDNNLMYVIETVTGSQETTISVDATTGSVSRRDVDDDGDVNDILDFTGIIEPDRAMAAATKASPGKVEEWKIGHDNGRLTYEVELQNGNNEVDVLVDAKTGEVIEVDD